MQNRLLAETCLPFQALKFQSPSKQLPCLSLGAKMQRGKDADEDSKGKRGKKRKQKSAETAAEVTEAPLADQKEHPLFAKLLRQARLHVSRIR